MPGKQPQDIDVTVGKNIRELREQKGWSRMELAQALAITAQQLNKYETGTNRITSSRLCQISVLLNADLSSLFEGTGVAVGQDASMPALSAESLAIAEAYERVRSSGLRQAIHQFLVSLCEDDGLLGGMAEPPATISAMP